MKSPVRFGSDLSHAFVDRLGFSDFCVAGLRPDRGKYLGRLVGGRRQ